MSLLRERIGAQSPRRVKRPSFFPFSFSAKEELPRQVSLFLEALGDALAIAEPLRTGREIVA